MSSEEEQAKLLSDIFHDDDDDDDDSVDKGGDVKGNVKRNKESQNKTKKRKLEIINEQEIKKKIQNKISTEKSDINKNTSSHDNDENNSDEDENEAEDGDEESTSEVDENEYQYDDFVVPENDDDDEDDDESVENSSENSKEDSSYKEELKQKEKVKHKRLKKRKDEIRLDDEDLELIRENYQPSQTYEDDDLNNESEVDHDDETNGKSQKYKNTDNTLDDDNNEDNDEDNEEKIIQPIRQSQYDDDGEDDDMSDFIEDDKPLEGEDDELALVKRDTITSSKLRRPPRRDGPTHDQIQDAREIFGDAFDGFFDDGNDDDDMVEHNIDGNENDDDDDPNRAEKKARDRLGKTYDRHVLVENFCTERDDIIRNTDRPERFQDILYDRSIPDSDERKAEAEWMAEKLTHEILSQSRINDGHFHRDYNLQTALVQPIQSVLRMYQVEQLEPPFIWIYRRDYLHPKMRRSDLWKMVSWDEQWERLYTIKQKLENLLQGVKDASDSRFEDKVAQDLEEKANRQLLKELTNRCKLLKKQVDVAEMEHKEAMDIVDAKNEKDEDTTDQDRNNVEERFQILEKSQSELLQAELERQDMFTKITIQRKKKLNQSQYDPNSAAEVLRLFPLERYAKMIATARDETELKDISDFLFLLLKGGTTLSNTKANRNKNIIEALDSSQNDMISQLSLTQTISQPFESSQATDTMDNYILLKALEHQIDMNIIPTQDSLTTNEDKPEIDKFAPSHITHHNHEESDGEEEVNNMDDNEMDLETQETFSRFQRTKASGRFTIYDKYRKIMKLRELIESFTVPACEFGDSLRHNYKVEPPSTCEQPPELVAMKYVDNKLLKDKRSVIRIITNMIAMEYSHEPNIKHLTRDILINEGTISTRPTTKGLSTITPFSELFGIHYLDRKPIRDFIYGNDKTLFLRLYDAERNDLISITVNLPEKKSDSSLDVDDSGPYTKTINFFLDDKRFFHSFVPSVPKHLDAYPESRQYWDQLRLQTLKLMLEKYLFPSLQKEMRRELLKHAKEAAIEETAAILSTTLRTGPLIPPISNVREYYKDLLLNTPKPTQYHTVVGIYVVNNPKEPLCLSYVNYEGVLKSHLLIPDVLSVTKKHEKIKQFLVESQPDLIVINASGGSASKSLQMTLEKNLLPQVIEMVNNDRKLKRESTRYDDDSDQEDVLSEVYHATVSIIKDDLANIFKRSSRAKKLFPDLESGSAASVSLARYAQDPLIEYCSIWTSADAVEVFGYEFLYLDFHPLKGLLKGVKLPLLRAAERSLVDAVCDVGVDINKAVIYDHIAPMLAFISGLGLRKADALRQQIKRTVKTVDSREILLTRKILGKITWINSSGFLRVTNLNESENAMLNPFDNTRIHPECYITYEFAHKIVCDALEVEVDPTKYYSYIETQMENSKKEIEKRAKNFPSWLDEWEKGRPNLEYQEVVVNNKTGYKEAKMVSVELQDALSLLDIEEFAVQLESEGKGKRLHQLEQIKEEIRYPWLDLRKPMTGMTEKDLFPIISGESDYSLYVGLKTGCYILEIREVNDAKRRTKQMAMVKTDIGLKGIISQYEVVDGFMDEDRFNMADHIQVGAHIYAVVIGVNKERGSVELSIKPSYLSTSESWWIERRTQDRYAIRWYKEIGKDPNRLFDRYFLETEALQKLNELESSLEKASKQDDNADVSLTGQNRMSKQNNKENVVKLWMRQVHHPLFSNCSFKEAEERLTREGKGAGEVIIRPSSKGPNMLTITWAFQDNWFKHIDVEELDKKEGSLGLSNKLVIREKDMEGEIFSDLDEIYARYIEPMNDFVSSMVSNKCFHTGSPTEVEATLEQDSIKNPNRIPYFIRFEPGFPGVFILTWYIQASTNKVKTLKIVVRPQGYRVLEETFTRPSELIAWFKEKAAKANERLNNKPLSVAQQIHKTLASVTQQQTQSQSNMAPQRRSHLFRSNVSTPAAMAFQHQPSMPIHPGPYIHQPSTPYGYQPPAPYLYQQQTQYQQPYMTPGRGPVGSSFQQPQYPPINYPPQQLPPRSYPRQNY